jgi:aromatic-amino-acid transaminase
MFAYLPQQPVDKIFALVAAYQSDPRRNKIDLGVGVYRDATGSTPVLASVKAAEAINQAEEVTKTYNRFIGDPAYLAAVEPLVFGAAADSSRVSASQTPGGTGALRMLLEVAQSASPSMTVWLPDPTWPNHPAMLAHMGIGHNAVPYFDAKTGLADIQGFLNGLSGVKAGDVVVLHGSCHNPTGADPDAEGWAALTAHAAKHGWVPLIDMAYHGFGDGLDEDAAGLRLMAQRLPEVMVALSFSKTFGLYRDRAGAALIVSDPSEKPRVSDALATVNRLAYSFAPHPSAAIVSRILTEADRRTAWESELAAMRARIAGLRVGLAEALRRETNTDRFDFITRQKGMFSRIGLPAEDVALLREKHAIYMVGDGRMNLAGLPERSIPQVANAIASVVR